MAASSQTLALPWYARNDYPVLLRLFSDSNMLPTTYDAWLERAEGVEQKFQSADFRYRQDLDSTHPLCGLVQGAERFS
jgi:hypothetical protein